MDTSIIDRIEAALGSRPGRLVPLSGGCIAQVCRTRLADGREVVVKIDAEAAKEGPGLEPEGFMLRYLAGRSRLPVPRVLYCDASLLAMEFVESDDSPGSESVQVHAAILLADLHSIYSDAFGLERDTLIGSIPQPNPRSTSWPEFFRDHRLLYLAGLASRAGRLPRELSRRIDRLASRVGELLPGSSRPSLIHGDVWSGNVLAHRGRVAAMIDPAIYYADPEIELAFITLFSTFDEAFFRRYGQLRPIAPGFFESRRHLYHLYPLLVHVHLFGAGYVGSVDESLRRLGF